MPRLGDRHLPVRGRAERNRLVVENQRLSYFAARLWEPATRAVLPLLRDSASRFCFFRETICKINTRNKQM